VIFLLSVSLSKYQILLNFGYYIDSVRRSGLRGPTYDFGMRSTPTLEIDGMIAAWVLSGGHHKGISAHMESTLSLEGNSMWAHISNLEGKSTKERRGSHFSHHLAFSEFVF